MKLKRMAAVAAAAVVGPVLLTTPAMAEEQKQPAVTVPDTAPKDDAPAAGGTAEETTEKGAQTPLPAPAPAPETTSAPAPETTSAPAPAPAPATGEQTQAAKDSADTAEAPQDSILMGPDVTVAGVPKGGFKAGGGWTPLTVTVDNSAHIEVRNYTPRIGLSQREGRLKADRIKVEHLVTDSAGKKSWQPAEFIDGHDGSYFDYSLATKASVARESVYTIDVRISFAADTAVVPFELSSDGLSIRTDGGKAWSATTYYQTSIAGAAADADSPVIVDGPSLTLNGVPADGFKAGGDWTRLGLHVDNTGKQPLKQFSLAFTAVRPGWSPLKPEHLQIEFYGKNGWERLEATYADGVFVYFEIGAPRPIASGQQAEVKLRIRFTKDAPLGDIVLRAVSEAEDLGSGDHHVYINSSHGRLTKILAADPNTGGSTGNQPKPNGGTSTTPISTGTGTGTTANGGELAATGSDPATSWALGGAGAALALGAALVAGTGRHRRRTTA
ncbi:hypothetical protein AB0D94_14035 [Streptomyces sp. NPDC048255]|uniref:hypothetical protein n=1 Tax=Streptomyces sp. NPDC048255 TaxID=3154713 RepID=UPI0033C99398